VRASCTDHSKLAGALLMLTGMLNLAWHALAHAILETTAGHQAEHVNELIALIAGKQHYIGMYLYRNMLIAVIALLLGSEAASAHDGSKVC
jgi:hypothetical protein